MKNKLKLLPLSVAVLFTPAYAEEKTYVGASVGQVSGACDNFSSGIDCDDGLGFRGFAGRRLLGKYLAVEIGYTVAPKAAEFSVTDSIRGNPINIDGEIDYSAYDVSFVGRYSFNDIFAVSTRIGAAFWEQEETVTVTASTVSTPTNHLSDGTDLLYGVGMEITPAKSFSIRGEWTRVAADVDVDYLSLSAAYRF